MNNKKDSVSEEFKKRVENFIDNFLNYDELQPKDKVLYDFIAEICKEEENL